jgi:alpha-L-rhamnosidase
MLDLHICQKNQSLFSIYHSPQRNERRGWMGDAALSVDEALYNFDLIKFYQNFLNLIGDMQLDNGEIPDIVPGGLYPADPNWGTALPSITWQLYRHYRDPKILEPYYDRIRAYVESLRSGYNNTGLANLFFRWGDWLPPSPYPQTNQHLTSSFAFLHDVYLLINMSQVLQKTNDTNVYSALYQQLAEEFHRVFFNTTSNFYADGMQAAQALALALPGVVPANLRGAIVDYLATNISKTDNHATTGIVSTAQLYPVLSDNGHHDLALEMISSTTYPSYGYTFNNPYENATTLWEVWNAATTGVLASHNHIMYGSVGAWFYTHLAGIDLSSEMITIRPRMASEHKKHLMKKLDCQLSTLYGLVHISYTRDERDTIANSILLRVTIPPNARARIIFEPLFVGGQCATLIENDKVIWSSDAVATNYQEFNVEKDAATGLMTVHIGSGQYDFQALWK